MGNGSITPITRTLEEIEEAERPKTKKQVRSFLGLTGYHRDFIQNYSTIAFSFHFHFQFFRHGSPSVKEKLFYRGPCI